MKNLILMIGVIIFSIVISCGPSDMEKQKIKERETRSYELSKTSKYHYENYEEYSLEGCQYIVVDNGDRKWGSHKGNCNNPIHQIIKMD